MSEDTTELQVELEKVRKALSAANAEAKGYREAKEALEARVTELESDDNVKVWKDKALKAEIKAALKEQGVKDTAKVLKVLDLEGVDLDDSGKLTGFDEKLAATKKEWSELFDAKRRVGGGADIFKDTDVKPTQTPTEMQVARLMNKTG
jgi:exonuclease VII small subunit